MINLNNDKYSIWNKKIAFNIFEDNILENKLM